MRLGSGVRAGLVTICPCLSIIISLLTIQEEPSVYKQVCFSLLTFIPGNLFKVWWNGTQTSNGTWTKYGSVVNGNGHSLQEIKKNCISQVLYLETASHMYSVHIIISQC